MKSEPCSCFLAYSFGKKFCENDMQKLFVPLFHLCSTCLLLEIHFAVRKFVKGNNNKSFIELACLVCIGKIYIGLVLFVEVYGKRNLTNILAIWTSS